MKNCELTSCIRIQPVKGPHQADTDPERHDNGQSQAAELAVQAPSVKHDRYGKHGQKVAESTVEPVLWQPDPASLRNVPLDGHVRGPTAHEAADDEARGRGDVDEAADQRRREAEPGVDDVPDAREEAELRHGEEAAGEVREEDLGLPELPEHAKHVEPSLGMKPRVRTRPTPDWATWSQ
jgi:hypothetical protein